jgi:hypothetical protein
LHHLPCVDLLRQLGFSVVPSIFHVNTPFEDKNLIATKERGSIIGQNADSLFGGGEEIALDNKELIKLYKTTLEESRHHDTVNLQILAAVIVVAALFLAAIGYLFNKDFPLLQQYAIIVKIGVIVFSL